MIGSLWTFALSSVVGVHHLVISILTMAHTYPYQHSKEIQYFSDFQQTCCKTKQNEIHFKVLKSPKIVIKNVQNIWHVATSR
jgi:hypothetical protein